MMRVAKVYDIQIDEEKALRDYLASINRPGLLEDLLDAIISLIEAGDYHTLHLYTACGIKYWCEEIEGSESAYEYLPVNWEGKAVNIVFPRV